MSPPDIHGDEITLSELVAQLSQAVGDEKARAVVIESAQALGLAPEAFTRQQALDVLERIAHTPGLVGVCARFARSRVMLRPPPRTAFSSR